MRKRHRPEQFVVKPRQVALGLAADLTIAQVCQKFGIRENTFHRW